MWEFLHFSVAMRTRGKSLKNAQMHKMMQVFDIKRAIVSTMYKLPGVCTDFVYVLAKCPPLRYNTKVSEKLEFARKKSELRETASAAAAGFSASRIKEKGHRIMDFLTSNSALMLQRSMDYLWTKQSCILDNVANAETPGYKAKYATFEESLQQAVQSAGNKAGGMRDAIESATISVQQAQESTRLDDNGVNVTDQMIELSRNGYQIQYVLDAINSDFALLRSAIKG